MRVANARTHLRTYVLIARVERSLFIRIDDPDVPCL